LEQKLDKVSFSRIDADVIGKLIQKEEALPSKLSEEQQNQLKETFEKTVNKEVLTVVLENMDETDLPVYITKPEFLRRWNDMQKMTGETGFYGMEIVNETDETKAQNISKQLVDLAMLSQQMLKGEALSNFINRSIDMMNK
jgi:molecular chaperone HtpG